MICAYCGIETGYELSHNTAPRCIGLLRAALDAAERERGRLQDRCICLKTTEKQLWDRLRVVFVGRDAAEAASLSAWNHECEAKDALAALRARIDEAPVAWWCEACQQAMQLSFGGDCGPCGRPLRRVRLMMIIDPEVPNV